VLLMLLLLILLVLLILLEIMVLAQFNSGGPATGGGIINGGARGFGSAPACVGSASRPGFRSVHVLSAVIISADFAAAGAVDVHVAAVDNARNCGAGTIQSFFLESIFAPFFMENRALIRFFLARFAFLAIFPGADIFARCFEGFGTDGCVDLLAISPTCTVFWPCM